MPFQMKIQPLDARPTIRSDPVKPAAKSRLKRLFEWQFTKLACADVKEKGKDGSGELEPSSVCLDKLVVSFMEDGNDRPARCGRTRCSCFNGYSDDSSDDDLSLDPPPPIVAAGSGDALETLKVVAISSCKQDPGGFVDIFDKVAFLGRLLPKTDYPLPILQGLVPCESLAERNLLADASKIVEASKSKIGKGKDDCIKIVTENLQSLGYDALICKSKWEKTPSVPAGEYEYIDVVIGGDRFIVDVDFRSEFEIARSTKIYRAVLQSLPLVFVGKPDRVNQIVGVVCEAARQSLKKKGLHFPPWRKLEYMTAKWLSPYERMTAVRSAPSAISAANFNGEFEMRGVVPASDKITVVVSQWTPPAVRPKSVTAGAKVVTGLSSVLTEKPPSQAKF